MEQIENEDKSGEKDPGQNLKFRKRMKDGQIQKYSYKYAIKCYRNTMKLKFLERLNPGEKDENFDS